MKGLRARFNSSSIWNRIVTMYTAIFGVSFTTFALIVFIIPQITSLSVIDTKLGALAAQIQSSNIGRDPDNVLRIPLPSDLNNLETANTFFMILDTNGGIILRSQNLTSFDGLLDPNGFYETPYFSFVSSDNVKLRVLTVPLFERGAGGQQIVGHLQVARLFEQSDNIKISVVGIFLGVASVLFAFLMVFLVTPNLLKPLVEIADIARHLTQTHDLRIRIPDVKRKDEIGDLTIAINQLLERLEKVDQEKTDFITVASHELRTPLTPLRSCLEFMLAEKYGPLNEKQKDRLEIALASVHDETRLIGNYLDFSRLQEERTVFEPKTEDVIGIVESVSKIFEYDARQKQIEFIKNLPDEDRIELKIDANQIRQVLTNIIHNAIKFTPSWGTVIVSVEEKRNIVIFKIKDTGIGIPEEDLTKIFEKYYQVDATQDAIIGGTGIGLNIAKEYIKMHDGEIWAQSELGKWTEIAFLLRKDI